MSLRGIWPFKSVQNQDKEIPKNTPILIPPCDIPEDISHLPKFHLSGTVPTPPNWEDRYNGAIAKYPDGRTRFIRLPLAKDSSEYRVLNNLMHSRSPLFTHPPLVVENIDLVINMVLWRKFLVHHKQKMGAKSTNMSILGQLGLNLDKKTSTTFPKAKEYADNICLLFHGTKAATIDIILQEGLDERMAKGGNLGHGIYFSDDPYKSKHFDGSGNTLLLCAVFLGDCLQVTSNLDRTKGLAQMRSSDDTQFDSIVGSPRDAHEFMIFSRFQCYPLYVINYRKETSVANIPENFPFTTVFSKAQTNRRNPLPFSWQKHNPKSSGSFWNPPLYANLTPNQDAIPPESISIQYPFFAQTIFKLMHGDSHVEYDFLKPSTSSMPAKKVTNETKELLAQLRELGFQNDSLSLDLLTKHRNDLTFVLDELYQLNDENEEDETDDTQNSESKECKICAEEFPGASKNWTKSNVCEHEFCKDCFKQLEITRSTMSWISHTFFKCPFCMARSGIEIGDCPSGTMNNVKIKVGDGDWIKITYTIFDRGYSLNRVAYLPSNPEGQKILELLQLAWDRRLIFTIGTSNTTGQTNTLVWNVHHKTSISGGIASYGYPDEGYFGRVSEELKQFGIE